ncbi:hypothetical protein ACQP25_13295 [Microtetraspora malaysiensis]|uniref:hypothetical protein n=1 Tax=Microtetraspora malaysiensis TaxID=161358 RepID=UPI003D8F779F
MASIHQTADLVVDAVALGLQEYECGWGARAPGVDAGRKFADLLTWQATRAKLTAFHEKHPEYGYSIHFDAAKDATVVTGNLPKSLAEVLRTTAGKVILDMADGNTVREDIGHFPANVTRKAREGVGRMQDRGPWHFGGARIESDSGVCSSGFSMISFDMKNVEHTYSVTAGHCGYPNANWLSGGYEYGVAVYRVNFPQSDIFLLQCCYENYGDRIWTSPNTTRKVAYAWDASLGWNTPAGGSGICVSGGVSGFEE